MATKKPRIALVGVGRFGNNHFRVLKELEKEGLCELCGVADINDRILANIRENYEIKTSMDYRDFLTDDVDAIDIVTPTGTHFNLCEECLKHEKHVFVEKPLTTDCREAQKLVGIASKKKKTLMAGHIFRYTPAVWKIKELMKKRILGKIYYMFGHFHGLANPRSDVGALFNYASHHIDIYDYLLEKIPTEVVCHMGHFLERKELEDVAVLLLRYPPNVLGIIEVSWLPPEKQRDLTVVGSGKSVTSNLLKQTLELHDVRMEKHKGGFKAVNLGTTKIDLEYREPLRLELLDFIKSIETGRKPLASGQAVLNVIKVAEKALKSAKLGKSVAIR